MARRRRVAVAACVALLAGCAPAPQLPAGPTDAELKAYIQQQNELWWESIAPGEPMPVIEPIEYIKVTAQPRQVTDCILDYNFEGVVESQGNVNGGAVPLEQQNAYQRAQFACAMLYPYEYTSAEDFGLMSRAQLEYLYAYFTERLVPCMELMGYTVTGAPTRDMFVNSDYLNWAPYYAMAPQPQTARDWERVDLRCPPPPFGQYWRPGTESAIG